MTFRRKADVVSWLDELTFFSYDPNGDKYYFVFEDPYRNGRYTLMRYDNGVFTLHGQGEGYCDETEKEIPFNELVSFVWKHRKYIHREMRVTS